MNLKRLFVYAFLLCPLFAGAQVNVALTPQLPQQFFDSNGVPLSNGCLFTYAAGSTTPLATYTDSTGMVANTNPIQLNGSGYATDASGNIVGIWLGPQKYKLVLFSSGSPSCSAGSQIWALDNVAGNNLQLQTAITFSAQTAPSCVATNYKIWADSSAIRWKMCNNGTPDNIVGTSTTDTLSNKTLSSPTVNSPAVSGGTFSGNPTFLSAVTFGSTGTPPQLSESTNSCCTGFLESTTGLHLNSSIVLTNGAIQQLSNDGYIQMQDGGKNVFVQAGPRGKEGTITNVAISANVLTITGVQDEGFTIGDTVFLFGTQESFLNGQTVTVASSNGTTQFTANFTHTNFSNASDTGEAVTGVITANLTLDLPDVSDGGSSDSSGYLLGVPSTDYFSGAGHCGFFSGGTAGIMHDSGFGCNSNLVFPVPSRFIVWSNSSNAVNLTAASATGNRTAILPDATGTVLLATEQTCGTTTTCSATNETPLKIVRGTVALTSASPSTATVTGFNPAFTSSSSFNCTVSNATTAANGLKVVNASSSSITITGPNTVTDTASYICIGT